eukprot:TRINITY_DN30831_c0_g1_i1.p1 TRINITY_DN30831_c0_g1~~TRINITY_DN30831_c0_g1_i1.p1  ORF type:complete len:377 (+),score=54.58 TRINITY_DN30831_c0_g1_i1:54-1184(+)
MASPVDEVLGIFGGRGWKGVDELCEALRIEEKLVEGVHRGEISADDERGVYKNLSLVCYTSVEGVAHHHASLRATRLDITFHLYDGEAPVMTTSVLNNIVVGVPLQGGTEKRITWVHQGSEEAMSIMLSHEFPVGAQTPSEIRLEVNVQHAVPHYRLHLRSVALRAIMKGPYGLRAVSGERWSGSSSEEVFKAFLKYANDENLIVNRETNPAIRTNTVLEEEFGCKLITLAALQTALNTREFETEAFSFAVQLNQQLTIPLPCPVYCKRAVPNRQKRKPVLNSITAQQRSLLDTARAKLRKISVLESLGKDPVEATRLLVSQQTEKLSEITDPPDWVKKREMAESDAMWGTPIGVEALHRLEEVCEMHEVRRLAKE